jgi:hypothetical protein
MSEESLRLIDIDRRIYIQLAAGEIDRLRLAQQLTRSCLSA